MKKFVINCDFGGQIAPFAVYIGTPKEGNHPIERQADWLSKERGGAVPAQVMDAIAKLNDLANKNGVPLDELCVYALGAAGVEEDDDDADEQSSGSETADYPSDTDQEYGEDSSQITQNTDEQLSASSSSAQSTNQEGSTQNQDSDDKNATS